MKKIYIILAIALAGCSTKKEIRPQLTKEHKLHYKLSKEDPANIHYKGHYKIGGPYYIKGKKYIPKEDYSYNEIGVASWYGGNDGCHGKKTANGDIFNKNLLTAAHKSLPLPSIVKVTNLENNKSLIVMVNDRGPFAKNRLIDLSERAAELLEFKHKGTAKVRVRYLPKETKEFLTRISLEPKSQKMAKKPTHDQKCSINCHIKLINLQHNLHNH